MQDRVKHAPRSQEHWEGQCGSQHLSSQDRLLKNKGVMGARPQGEAPWSEEGLTRQTWFILQMLWPPLPHFCTELAQCLHHMTGFHLSIPYAKTFTEK